MVGLPDERWGAVPAAAIVPASDDRPSADDELARHCRAQLAGYKVPVRFLRLGGAAAGQPRQGPANRDCARPSPRTCRDGPPLRLVSEPGQPLLLLHATLSSSRQLRALAARLAMRFTVISVDRRGSGRSPLGGPAEPIDVAVHVADLVAIARDASGWSAPPWSGTATVAASRSSWPRGEPDLVGAVFAYEPPYGPLAPAEAQAGMAEVARQTLARRAIGDDLAGAALAFMAGVAGAAAVAALGARRAGAHRSRRAGSGRGCDPVWAWTPTASLRIGCPVRIATGDRQRGPLRPASPTALVTRIDGADHARLEGLDHMAPVTAARGRRRRRGGASSTDEPGQQRSPAAGRGDVRPHLRCLRRHEPGHQRLPGAALAPAPRDRQRDRPGPASARCRLRHAARSRPTCIVPPSRAAARWASTSPRA